MTTATRASAADAEVVARPGPVRAVHTVSSLQAALGGPSRSVTALCSALADRGVDVEIVTREESADLVRPDDSVRIRFVDEGPAWQALRPRSSALVQGLTAALSAGPPGAAVLHDHGLWLPQHRLAAAAAAWSGVPLVVSVRGMLSPWALRQNRLKKKVAWTLFQRRVLAAAALLHATSEEEVENVRRLGIRRPVALISNGVDVPEQTRTLSEGRRSRQALFLGRLHPVKGLLNLVRAWAQVRPEGWELVLAGPDDDGHRADIEQAARALRVAPAVRFTGTVGDDEKWDLYADADLFVLPSHSENFGIVVAEALAAGVPALTTKGTPWQDLETHACGWWVEVGAEPLAQALAEATSASDERRQAMGARGRALVEQHYSWAHVADEMAAVYAWLLGQGERPDCVVL